MGLNLFCIISLLVWQLGEYLKPFCLMDNFFPTSGCEHVPYIYFMLYTISLGTSYIYTNNTNRGGMFPGCCHFYALFYFGFSEISTAILCLLANFDPEFGVVGLSNIFPKTKIVLGALFVTTFIICRLIMWPFTTYYFARDTLKAIRSDSPHAEGRRGFLWLICSCCAVLSLIQLVFVAMIVKIGREELEKLMNPEV